MSRLDIRRRPRLPHDRAVHRFLHLSAAIAICLLTAVGCSTEQPPTESFDVVEATIGELQEAMAAGRVTAVALVESYLERIEAYDRSSAQLNAILRINPGAREVAAALDEERRKHGPRGPLHGIPIILKDNYGTADMPTSAGSIALAGFVPARDAFQVRKLREAGAVILAKSNLHELAMGMTTISSLGDQTRNPYDPQRNPGGSSGGTGAAIAASFAAVGMGSDTCGSIRIPAAHNNLVGLRPTKGLSSIAGIIPLAHTQDVGGPLARTVEDLAIVLDATIGADANDPATAMLEGRDLPHFTDALSSATLRSVRLGKLTELFESDVAESAVIDIVDAALEHFESEGAEIVEVEIPDMLDLLRKSGVITHEFKWDLIDYLAANPGAPVGSLTEILEKGLHHTALKRTFERQDKTEERDSDEYRAALQGRDILRDAVVQILDDHRLDAFVYPTLVRRPSLIGEPQRGSNCSLSANSGLPAISVPAGFTADGLPVGMELLGRRFSDAALVALAYAFEQSTDHRRAPAAAPPLVEGAPPAPVNLRVADTGGEPESNAPSLTVARFSFDVTTGTLEFSLRINAPAEEIHAATLHQGEEGNGPVIARLSGLAIADSEGRLRLSPADGQALMNGDLFLRVFTRDRPTGVTYGPLLTAGSGLVQRSEAWFRLAPPSGLGDPHRPVVRVDNLETAPALVPRGEESYQALDGSQIRSDLERIIGFSRQSRAAGDRVWGRVTGFAAAEATVNWVARQFRAAGLSNVKVQEYAGSGEMWWSRSWEVRLLGDRAFGAGSEDVILESALPTAGSQIAGDTLTAALVNVGSIDEEIPEIPVAGKVAVQRLQPQAGAYSERRQTRERARALMDRGAVAVLNVVEQTGNMHVRDFSSCNGPCFNLGTADGRFLIEVIERARAMDVDEPRIRLELQSEMLTGLVGHNTVGIVPGRSDENIIVNAHADGWFDAAGDNGDGLAVLVALARYFGRPENRLDRTLVFVASGGHHSSGLNGPSNFVRMNPALTTKTVLVLNLEHIAQLYIRSGEWNVEPTEQPMNFGISNEAPLLIKIARRGMELYGFRLNPEFRAAVPGDLGGYRSLGVPRVQAIHSGSMYHTSGDVLETISIPGLERAARFYAFFVREVAKAGRSEIGREN